DSSRTPFHRRPAAPRRPCPAPQSAPRDLARLLLTVVWIVNRCPQPSAVRHRICQADAISEMRVPPVPAGPHLPAACAREHQALAFADGLGSASTSARG